VEGNDLAVAARTRDLLNATIVRSRQMVYEARHNLSAISTRCVFPIIVEHCDWRSARHTTNSLSRTAAFVLANLISHDSTTLAAGCKRKEFAGLESAPSRLHSGVDQRRLKARFRDSAQAMYNDPEYHPLKALRQRVCKTDAVLAEGSSTFLAKPKATAASSRIVRRYCEASQESL